MVTADILMTLNNRNPKVVKEVLEAALPQAYVTAVLDRPEQATEAACISPNPLLSFKLRTTRISGESGWICPARAWNHGFSKVKTDYVICLSSDVVLEQNAARIIEALIQGPPVVVFGKCVDDGPLPLVKSATPNLLCGADHPRPLGFIMALPMWAVRTIGGYDEAFMDGLWYEDDDFTLRLARLGLPFVFDDRVSGTHRHHERPVLETTEGQRKIAHNKAILQQKWKEESPWKTLPLTGWRSGQSVALSWAKRPNLLEAWTRWACSSPSRPLEAKSDGPSPGPSTSSGPDPKTPSMVSLSLLGCV